MAISIRIPTPYSFVSSIPGNSGLKMSTTSFRYFPKHANTAGRRSSRIPASRPKSIGVIR
jgi:hypothetical protein